MGVYDNYADYPEQIKKEGQEITITFQRTSDTTARISWNIPPPSNGCNSANQAYDGIVITLSSKPANYISTSPKDGTYYTADPTADIDLHAGDNIDDVAFVVGAFYHDKITTTVDISGIKPKTPYYVSGYAVDNVARYHREGAHSYSLPTGPQEFDPVDFGARHDITIDNISGIDGTTLTGLSATKSYNFSIKLEHRKYTITVNGVDAQTYDNLVIAINKQLALIVDPFIGAQPPNTNAYYFDTKTQLLFQWDGFKLVEIEFIPSIDDPAMPVLGTYWRNTTNNVLSLYESSGWVEQQAITFPTDPTRPPCNALWFDGIDAWEWNETHWCKLCAHIQERNPLLPPIFSCDTYWYDKTSEQFFKWNFELKKWDDSLVLFTAKDPNTLTTGDFWFNETTDRVFQFVGGLWNELTNIRYSERDANGDLPSPPSVPLHFWYIPSESLLFQRNATDTDWIPVEFVAFPTDPLDRKSCDLWWNSSPSIDSLFVWDAVNVQWVLVNEFIQSNTDPSLPPTLPECAVWFNPETNELIKLFSSECNTKDYINSAFDPITPPLNSVWFDDDKFRIWNGVTWIVIDPINNESDPYAIDTGTIWYNPDTNTFFVNNGVSWDILPVSTISLVPAIGATWYDSVNEKSFRWNGKTWIEDVLFASVSLVLREKLDDKDLLRFTTKRTGCKAEFEVLPESDNLFGNLTFPIMYMEPLAGADGIFGAPMYKQLGIGDDGSPDERRALHEFVRNALGHPAVRVELTKQQIDQALDNALLMLRKKSSYAYKRGLFFLDLNQRQQKYILSSKCVGFNKIADVNGVYRMRAGAFRTAFGHNDTFGFAALQQLYRLGTFDILTFHLSMSYIEDLETLFASKILFQWFEPARELRIYQMPRGPERVLIDSTLERTEQDLFTNRETSLWIKRWAVAECKQMLSQIRGKFQTLPGPQGSTVLNSQELITQAETERAELTLELEDMEMKGPVDIGMRAHFIFG